MTAARPERKITERVGFIGNFSCWVRSLVHYQFSSKRLCGAHREPCRGMGYNSRRNKGNVQEGEMPVLAGRATPGPRLARRRSLLLPLAGGFAAAARAAERSVTPACGRVTASQTEGPYFKPSS